MLVQTSRPALHLQDCTYTSCYCEENVYVLLKRLEQQQGHSSSNLFALFISNSQEMVPFWHQRASSHPDGFVIWDYHVSKHRLIAAAPEPPPLSSPLVSDQPYPMSCLSAGDSTGGAPAAVSRAGVGPGPEASDTAVPMHPTAVCPARPTSRLHRAPTTLRTVRVYRLQTEYVAERMMISTTGFLARAASSHLHPLQRWG